MASPQLPVPWRNGIPPEDVDGVLRAVAEHAASAPAIADLTEVLERAKARIEADPADAALPPFVRCAHAMLEMAVEWRIPEIERWAVAWLVASGSPQFRLRWSSRARDGRFARNARVSGEVTAMAGDGQQILLGTSVGVVREWVDGRGLRTLPASVEWPDRISALTVRAGRWAAGGPQDRLRTGGRRTGAEVDGWAESVPPPTGRNSMLTALAVAADGLVAVGDEAGRVRVWEPERRWTSWSEPRGPGVIALAWTPTATLRVLWGTGVAEECPVGSPGSWSRLVDLDRRITVGAWSRAAELLAVADDAGRVELAYPPAQRSVLWQHGEVESLAWSPGGKLASAGANLVRTGAPDPRVRPDLLTTDDPVRFVAFLGEEQVVTAGYHMVEQWRLDGVGSEDPTVQRNDGISALAIAPHDRSRVLIGTRLGRLREFDGYGVPRGFADQVTTGEIYRVTWAPSERAWLYATVDGAHLHPAESGRERVSRDRCQSVAAAEKGYAVAREGYAVAFSDARPNLPLDGVPEGMAFDDRTGTLVVVDEEGYLRLSRPDGVESPTFVGFGTRLVGAHQGAALLHRGNGRLQWRGLPGGRLADGPRICGQVPPGSRATVAHRLDPLPEVIVAYPDNLRLLAGDVELARVSARPRLLAVAAGRVAVASENQVGAFDVLEPRRAADGVVELSIGMAEDGFRVRFPSGEVVLAAADVERLVPAPETEPSGTDPAETVPSETVARLSETVFQAGLLGDQLWHGGLDLEVDLARGTDPNRAVQIRWSLDGSVEAVPWELLHRSIAPLAWFHDPPTTGVRVVPVPAEARGRRALGPVRRPSMLVIRASHPEMQQVDEAYEQVRRRTRRNNVRLLTPRPTPVASPAEIGHARRQHADVVQVWAHSDDTDMQFEQDGPRFPHAEVAAQILGAAVPPRLVVLVGCRSALLGRLLVSSGVQAAVAMRVEVYSRTVAPLVEEFVAGVLAGDRVDLAFAEALRRYVLTGQPGAAAVPMLYLADDLAGVVFPVTDRSREVVTP